MNRRGASWRIAVAAGAVLAVTGVVAVVWQALAPAAEVNRADVAAVAMAAITLAGTVAVWAHRSRSATIPTGTGAQPRGGGSVDGAAELLASLVEQQWRDEAGHLLLDDPEPIPVHWQLIADTTVMSLPRLITTEAELNLTGRSDEIAVLAEAFRGLKRRRLVIAGGEGTGKTTLAIQLLLQLLSMRPAHRAASDGRSCPSRCCCRSPAGTPATIRICRTGSPRAWPKTTQP